MWFSNERPLASVASQLKAIPLQTHLFILWNRNSYQKANFWTSVISWNPCAVVCTAPPIGQQ